MIIYVVTIIVLTHLIRRASDSFAALRLVAQDGCLRLPPGLRRSYCIAWKGNVMSLRPVKQILQTTPTLEGAGVKLQRAFGFGKTKDFDPFLLFDDFRNERPQDYLAGFPWHPHRGIETITYVLAGSVEHGDSLGNKGKMTAGDVQWMTAGSGILHQEMPKGDAARPHARLSTVGQSALIPENDRAPLSGHSGQRHSRSHRR